MRNVIGETSITFDTVLDLCRDQRRRIVLAVFAEEQSTLALIDLSKVVLKHNRHTPVTEVTKEVLTLIRLSLYHMHIPTLASAGRSQSR